MLRLRPYKYCDAENIVNWINTEEVFNLWGGNLFGSYPLAPEMINEKYFEKNGDCKEEDNFYPWTVVEDDKAVGHFIMRYIHGDRKNIRFGWVIIDPEIRGKGYAHEMLQLGMEYAFHFLGAERVGLGVYSNNTKAYKCYKSLGLRDIPLEKPNLIQVGNEQWEVLELAITKEEYENSVIKL